MVSPLAVAERAAFAKKHHKALKALLSLRQQLRDPNLGLDEWHRLQARAQALTIEVTQEAARSTWGKALGDDGAGSSWPRVEQVGVFLYEIEFPEVFFDEKGMLKPEAGFDVVLGNPPWEEPAAEFKHFLPEFDPDYNALSGQASLAREAELLDRPEIGAKWARFKDSVADYKLLLDVSGYRFQRRKVKGKIPGAPVNLYKFATEKAYQIVKLDGLVGLVVDGGLWNDLSASGLRQLLIDHNELLYLVGFSNNQGLFDIHRSYKFGCIVFKKGGITQSFKAFFMRTKWEDLDMLDVDGAEIDASLIRDDERDSYPIPEVRNRAHFNAEQALSRHENLGGSVWSLDYYSREFHAGEQRHFFFDTKEDNFRYPLIQGKHFNHWGVHDGQEIEHWIDPRYIEDTAGQFLRQKQENRLLKLISEHIGATSDKQGRARAWIKAQTGDEALPDAWMRLDWDDYRLCWRDIARNDDRRTLIAGIIPPGCAVTHTAPFVRSLQPVIKGDQIQWHRQLEAPQLLYLAGMLSSYATDSVARSRLSKTHLTGQFFLGLPIPPWADTARHHRIAELTARLTCRPATAERPWADYAALAAGVGLTPKDALLDPQARLEAEVELNVLANGLYGLDRAAFRFLINTLFDTPAHREAHFHARDLILAQQAS